MEDILYPQNIFPLVPVNDKYKYLETKITELTKTNNEIQEQFKIEKSIPQKIKLIIKNKLFKTEIKTLDELIDQQLRNTNSLDSCLDLINKESRKELKNHEKYYEHISISFETRIKSVKERRKNLICLAEQFKSLQTEFLSIKKSDSEYFSKERKLKQIERKLKEEKHLYIMNNDCIIGLGQEKNSLEITESFLRNSIHVCERVSNKINNMRRHLENTKRVYRKLRQQHKTISSLGKAIKLIVDYSSQVQATLSNDLIKINNMLTEPNCIDEFYKNPILKETIQQIETTNDYNDQEIDDMIQNYLSS
jgi:hypothetical protein